MASQRRRAALGRLAAASLLTTSLVLSGCPVTPVARSGGAAAEAPREPDPGPPEVLNPSLLDRG
jgi:hypothetical protein